MYILLFFFIVSVHGYGWVPLCDLNTFHFQKPNEIKVLDKHLVVWQKNGQPIVQDNHCLHRGAPLSEGYIDKDSKNLRCSYHGWEFSENGNVVSIPQSLSNCSQCKFQQNTYQTHSSCNILWVNLNDSFLPFPNHISENNHSVCDDVFVIEVPYSINILLENLFDPAHVPFAHHKLQSSRDLASSVNSTVLTMNSSCFEVLFEDETLNDNQYRNGTMTFYSDSHYVLNSIYPSTFIQKLHVYCVPISPFKTRIFVQNQYNNDVTEGVGYNKFFTFILNSFPRWFKHSITHTFFDSDTMLLYKQEQKLRSNNMLQNCTKTYLTPTSSDYSIHSFHKWKNKYPPKWSSFINSQQNLFTDLKREEIFDRYNDHTKHCTSCSAALINIKTLQILLPFAIVFSYPYFENYSLICFGIVLYWTLELLKTHFTFRDYVHNDL